MKKNEIDAVILCSVENKNEVIMEYSKYGLIISSNDAFQSEDISNFHFDEQEIGYKATKFLINSGCENIGICLDNPFNTAQKSRLKGYKKALQEFNLEFNSNFVFTSAFTILDGIKIGKRIDGEKNNIIDGIFTGNDYVSAGVQKILKERVLLIGTDNHDVCHVTEPMLNSIELPIKEMAIDICNHLIESLSSEETKHVNKLYSSNIVTHNI